LSRSTSRTVIASSLIDPKAGRRWCLRIPRFAICSEILLFVFAYVAMNSSANVPKVGASFCLGSSPGGGGSSSR
jgi:hypothetical protein